MTTFVKVPRKIALPVVMSVVTGLLIFWDVHNQRVIESVGMGWDTGAPIWPYQTSQILLAALNLPAFVCGNVAAHFTEYNDFAGYAFVRYTTLFLATIVWWRLVSVYFDREFAGGPAVRVKSRAVLYFSVGAVFFFLAAESCREALHWWWTYSRRLRCSDDLVMLRELTPSMWCALLGVVALRAGSKRLPIRKQKKIGLERG